MSKDKKDKLKKYDLFSIMMDQSAVFRDMVSQFQKNFGFQSNLSPLASLDDEPAATASSEVPKAVKPKAAKKKANAKAAKAPTSGAKPAATKKAVKKVPAKKAASPAAKESVVKSVKKHASKKAFASKK